MALAWPKGTKFVGKVVRDSFKNVRRKNGESGDSMLSFRFDGAEVKGGAAVEIPGLVVAFSPSLASRPWIVPGSSRISSDLLQCAPRKVSQRHFNCAAWARLGSAHQGGVEIVRR
jgi:hypothetical protein